MKYLVVLALLLLVGVVAAQTSYTTADGVLSVVLPAGWDATEDAYQMFVSNREGASANTLEVGDVVISILRPALLRQIVEDADTPAAMIEALIPLALQEGENLSEIQTTELGAYLLASFSYNVVRSGSDAQMVVVQAGEQFIAMQIVTTPGELNRYAAEIRSMILSLRVEETSFFIDFMGSGSNKDAK